MFWSVYKAWLHLYSVLVPVTGKRDRQIVCCDEGPGTKHNYSAFFPSVFGIVCYEYQYVEEGII
jgi:hypothetical protein